MCTYLSIKKITGPLNATSTGLNEHFVKHKTGLTQIIRVLTRDTGVLDWFLTNKPKFFQPPAGSIKCRPSMVSHMVCPYSSEFSGRGFIFLRRL